MCIRDRVSTLLTRSAAAARSNRSRAARTPAASLPQAVQTQVCYLAGFHDEPKAKWVAAFGEPSVTLDVERVSDKSVQPRYHGLDAFCEESGTPDAVDYFSAMIRAATVRYSVRYEVGTVDDGRGSAADAARGCRGLAWSIYLDGNYAGATIYGNVLDGSSKGALIVNGGGNVSFYNNVVLAPKTAAVELSACYSGDAARVAWPGTTLRANVFYLPDAGSSAIALPGPPNARECTMIPGRVDSDRNLFWLSLIHI